MTLICSLEDLAQAKQEAIEAERQSANKQPFHIRVSLGSCGIAAGAQDTLDAINLLLASGSNPDIQPGSIRISKIGCLGLCALEPVIQVQTRDQPLVTYGKVTPEVARRIIQDHIGKGMIVQQYAIETT